jgi:hypothetical protein
MYFSPQPFVYYSLRSDSPLKTFLARSNFHLDTFDVSGGLMQSRATCHQYAYPTERKMASVSISMHLKRGTT